MERETGAPCSDDIPASIITAIEKMIDAGEVPTRADVELLRRSGTRIAIPG